MENHADASRYNRISSSCRCCSTSPPYKFILVAADGIDFSRLSSLPSTVITTANSLHFFFLEFGDRSVITAVWSSTIDHAAALCVFYELAVRTTCDWFVEIQAVALDVWERDCRKFDIRGLLRKVEKPVNVVTLPWNMAVFAMSTTISKLPSAVRAVASSSKLLTSNASLGFPSTQMRAENKFFQPQRLIGTCVRPMATSAARESSSEGSESKLQRREDGVPVSRGRTRRSSDIAPSVADFFDLWDPFFPDRNLREMMNTMKRVFRDPVDYSAPVDQQRTPWDVIEDGEGFKLRVDMPGLSKEEVTVTVEEGTLVIKGEHKADENKEENNLKWSKRSYGTYNTRLTLPKNVRVDQIKAELKNGVLYVSVPKAEEKKDVINVDVA